MTTTLERPVAKLRVYGSEISNVTGHRREVGKRTGTTQMPAVELPDGRWMTDTTPMIAWIETQQPEPEVIPRDPQQAYASRLLEDYAGEWLWRPALHYRWSYRADALLLSRRIADEMMGNVSAPGWLKRIAIRQRQLHRYVRGDGVTAATRAHVEGVFLHTLDQLEPIFAVRPFLLGNRPTLADFGFFASMFRHFGLDPTPTAIMLERAPGVYAWLARVWNARGARTGGDVVAGVPADWSPILREIATAYLPYLAANASAWKQRKRSFDIEIQGTPYRTLPVSRYRVWCLERLRAQFETLSGDARAGAQALLDDHGCAEPLWRVDAPVSDYDPGATAPLAPGLPVFGA